MSNKAIIAYLHQRTNEGMRLNLRSFTDDNILLNFDKRANKAMITDTTTIKI